MAQLTNESKSLGSVDWGGLQDQDLCSVNGYLKQNFEVITNFCVHFSLWMQKLQLRKVNLAKSPRGKTMTLEPAECQQCSDCHRLVNISAEGLKEVSNFMCWNRNEGKPNFSLNLIPGFFLQNPRAIFMSFYLNGCRHEEVAPLQDI